MTNRGLSLAAALCLFALFLAGCGAETVELEDLALSASGHALGPLTAATPFDADRLRQLFPDAALVETRGYSEGEPYPVLRLEKDGVVWLELRSADGTALHSVEILEPAASGRLSALHGSRYEDVYAGATPACDPGQEEESGRVICPAPFSAHLLLVFGGGWAGPDGRLPPAEVLRRWEVERVVWVPKAP